MKLIIDIPDTYYEYCKAQEDAIEIQLAVKNGTPLDDLRAEIKQLPYQRIFGRVSSYSLLDEVVEIIDKYRED